MGILDPRSMRARPGAFLLQAMGGVRKSKAGRELDGKTYDAMPGRVELPVMANSSRLAAVADIERLYRPTTVAAEPSLFPDADAAIR